MVDVEGAFVIDRREVFEWERRLLGVHAWLMNSSGRCFSETTGSEILLLF